MFVFVEEEEKEEESKTEFKGYEIFSTYLLGWTPHQHQAGDIINSMGFGSLDKVVIRVDEENKRYYVVEIE